MKVAKSSLFVVIALVVAVVGFFIYLQIEEAAEVARQRDKLLADIDATVSLGDASADDLGRLRVRLGEFDASTREIALALARLDVAQGRYGRATERLQPLMLGVQDPVMLRTAALAWLSFPLLGGRDGTERRGLWQQAMDYAQAAYASSANPSDLFLAWQAAARSSDGASMQSIGQQLLAGHPETLEARTVNQASASDLSGQGLVDTVDNLVGEWAEAPLELRLAAAQARVVGAMKAEAIEDAQDQLLEAVASLDALVQEAANWVEVRHWAATAHHLAGLAESAGAERDRHLQVRDRHLEWLATNASSEDPRLPSWSQMQSIR